MPLLALLNDCRGAIALDNEPLGVTDVLKHEIKIQDGASPVNQRPYKTPHKHLPALNKAVEDMLRDDVIEHSLSSWNSPLILVKKKDGTLRPCVDFRRLNKVTIPCRFPIPHLQDAIHSLHGAKYFSTLDAKSAFWQVPLTQSAAEKTSFTTSLGKFQFKRLPFGLVDSPAVFSALMSKVLVKTLGVSALVYLDDIIVFSRSKEEHFAQLREVLSSLQDAGLKISLKKSVFLQRKLKYLGHIISDQGVQFDSSKAQTIRDFPPCKSKDDIRRFLGFLSFYRNFVPHFAATAYPLTKLLRNNVAFEWSSEQFQAFSSLKMSPSKYYTSVPELQKAFLFVLQMHRISL